MVTPYKLQVYISTAQLKRRLLDFLLLVENHIRPC
nr:MAG TPA: hypothetical protein [Bacteriophage sp.]